MKLGGWPWKTIGHLCFAVSSFVQHFIAIGEFQLELQSGNTQFGSNSTILEPCDIEILRTCMTLKNTMAPLLCYFKLCASFRSHRWIQAGVTVRKRPLWSKSAIFFCRVTLQFEIWPWKTIGLLFYVTSSFVHHFLAIGDFKLRVTVRKCPIWVKFEDFYSRVTSQFDYDLEKLLGTFSILLQALCIIS